MGSIGACGPSLPLGKRTKTYFFPPSFSKEPLEEDETRENAVLSVCNWDSRTRFFRRTPMLCMLALANTRNKKGRAPQAKRLVISKDKETGDKLDESVPH